MEANEPLPILEPGHTYASITQKIISIPLTRLRRTPLGWAVGFLVAFMGVMVFLYAITTLFVQGVGIFGINIPVGWGFDIVNFVWWVGIGHAGTLISAILLLLRQQWRTSINRFAEAMTLFAVANAALFPIFHLGRPWLFFYLMPYPNTMGLWPQFRSPLVWDVFAITTYGLVSLLFWYMGLVPDLATLRDKAKNLVVRRIYGLMALGWRNSARHWHHYQSVYFLMAALAAPLVISVHSIVSVDFSYSIIPGWHSTIFPPYFVAGAVFSGFAMVLTLLIPLRSFFGLKGLITDRHLDNMAKVMLAVGLIVTYGYLMDIFNDFYSGVVFDQFNSLDRFGGYYLIAYWSLILVNGIIPQALWFKKVRHNPISLFVVAMFINVGMWLERYVIIVQSLSKDFLPSSWHTYTPTIWDFLIFGGTIAFFLFLIFMFIRFLPSISAFEMRELVHHETHSSEKEDSLSKEKPQGTQDRGDVAADSMAAD
jgi:molybdopterin-containing oxidoreductase family membrane subunit